MHSRRETVRSRKPEHHNVRQRVGSGTECTGASRFENQVGCLQRTNEPTADQLTNQITNNQQNRQDKTCFSATLWFSCLVSVNVGVLFLLLLLLLLLLPLEIVCLLKPRRRKRQVHFPEMFFFQGKSLRTVSRHCRIAHTYERRVESVECRLCPSRIHGERRGNYYPATRRKLSRFNNSNSICQRAKSACADLRYCRRK